MKRTRSKRVVARISALLCAAIFATNAIAEDDPTPTVEIGATVYDASCALCHGPHGMGEGFLPLRIRRYPKTNLIKNPRFAGARLREVIVYGGTLDDVHEFMPPMGNELTWTQIESVAMYIEVLRSDPKRARLLAQRSAAKIRPTLRKGMHIYNTKCSLCHGNNGQADGRMARIIKDPPPANLMASTLDDNAMLAIISAGGEAVGRSPQMPPWADQLSLPDIQSVIMYIKTLRAP